jgi:biopolymer transport protein ExbB
MELQFGLVNVWSQGDWVTKTVALVLLLMSLATWTVILIKTLDFMKHKKLANSAQDFWQGEDLPSALLKLGGDDRNPFRQAVLAGNEASQHHRNIQLDVNDWITRSLRNTLESSTARLQAGLAVLASVGSTAPFVGLFGTVWGIYHALLAIGASGEASIDKVAGPIGEALIMTALGLAVAIPAVLGYNALLRGNKSTLAKLNCFAYDLHAYFVTGARISSSA